MTDMASNKFLRPEPLAEGLSHQSVQNHRLEELMLCSELEELSHIK